MNLNPTVTGSKPGEKFGMGCLALFALPFAGVGVFTGCKAIGSFLEGKVKDGFLFLLFAVVFGSVGFGLLAGVVFGSKNQKRVKALQSAHPDEPWFWREDWAGGRIASSTKSAILVLWVFAAFWNLIADGVFFSIGKDLRLGNHMVWVALIFPLVGIGLLIAAIRATIRWRKFGQSWFKLLNNTGVIGGSLSGAVETSTKIRPAGGFQVCLRCVRRDSSGENTTEHILWEDEKVIVKDLLDDPRRSAIPVFFQLPADVAPSNDSDTNNKILWRLEVRAKMDGPDYLAQFEVPVFKTADTAMVAPVADPTLAFQAPATPYERPADSKIVVRAAPSGGTEFYFPACRNVGPAIGLFLFLVIWNGAIWFMIYLGAPIFFPIVFGFFDLILMAGLAAMLFKSSRITVDALGLLSEQDWAFHRFAKRFRPEEIVDINCKIGMTSGNVVYYDLQVVTVSQRALPLAGGIRDKREAQWLAAEMLRLLRSGPSTVSPAVRL